jgi:hypothetical protein
MRYLLIPILLVGILFFFPFQVFIIGNDTGIGIQGAVYRYQVTGFGNSLIPLPQEVMYIVNGIYSGKTALSVILWALGTILLTATTWYGIVFAENSIPEKYQRQVILGLTGSCGCFLCSCIIQYGIFLHGPPGTSIPFGIGILLIWLGILRFFPQHISGALGDTP